MSDAKEPKGPGRTASPSTPPESDLDFAPDALLDSLLRDEAGQTSRPTPHAIKLHEPLKREYSEDDVTVVGRTADLLARFSASSADDDGTTGLEELAGSDIDQLLSSLPPNSAELDQSGNRPSSAVLDLPPPPRLPAVPRPASRLSSAPASSRDLANLPAANPAGPPSRQPFPLAVSPQPPPARQGAGQSRGTLPGPGPVALPASTAPTGPAPAKANIDDDADERTRIFTGHSVRGSELKQAELLPDPFAEPSRRESGAESSVPPELEQQSRLPTLPADATRQALSTPSIPGPHALPAQSDFPEEIHEIRVPTPASSPGRSEPSGLTPESPAARADSNPASAPIQPSTPPSIFPDERPAEAHLSGQRDSWVTRAEWLENEARSTSDVQAKARLLIVASELWALVGELPKAREVAAEASMIPRAPSMAARQQRQLAAADGDFKAVTPALELEIRSAPTVEARTHAAYYSAELYRLSLRDEVAAKKKLDLAVRAQQDDPRAHVARFAELLGKSNAPARMRFPDSEAFNELARASDELLRMRGAPLPVGSPAPEDPRAAFDDARRALSSGEREKAADALGRLSSVDGLAHAAAWLSASLLGADPKTFARARSELAELAAEGGSRLARRALITRTLQQGDTEAVRRAVESPEGEATFSAPDRLALAALTGVSRDALESTMWDVANDPELYPLAAAFAAVASNSVLDLRVGSDERRAEQRLGQSLVSTPSETAGLDYLRPSAEEYEATHPDSLLSRFLALEFAKVGEAKGAVAVALGQWPISDDSAEAARDHRLAAALVHELAGEHSSAMIMYRAAFELDASTEAALRAMSHAAPDLTADLLVQLADELGASARTALLLIEAALRQGQSDSSSYQALLDRAKIAAPELSLTYRLAEVSARQSGDGAALLFALRARRDAADDPIEQALDLVREALLVADTDLVLAERLLEEALRARPSDLALRELAERMVPTEDQQRAAWRETLAESETGAARARLLAEAALERGRAGDHQAAAHNAYLAAELTGNELWRVVAERYAAAGPAATRISESLLARARATEDPQEQRQLYERLSELDRGRGDSSSALLWQNAILEQSPNYLPALRRLEHAYISGNRLDELEPIALSLARTLDASESIAHARLAARLRVRRGAWAETRELSEIAISHAPQQLWALRALDAHARAVDDNELLLRVDERLFELALRPLDKATLALRAAEAAARLERRRDTKRLLSLALQQVPDHLLALATLAEVLEADEEYVAAAEALETAARVGHVTAHQVSAWHHAGVLWLDRAKDPARGRVALEHAVELDVEHEDAVARLTTIYVAENDRQNLALLLERRLERTTDPEQRILLEVARGRALAGVGEREAAKVALSAALDANPDHAEALEAFAELCLEEGDWGSGEQALIRLARHVIELPRQVQIYRRLGELYETALPNPERALLAYREVLKRDPDNADAVARLVRIYGELGDKVTALSLQADLLTRATTAQEKRDRTLALAVAEEQIGLDRKRAEATFERARKEWPYDSVVLRGLVEFHLRHGETRAAHVLLDRATSDARRALGTGRFEPTFFEILATVAELKNAGDSALVARSTLAALHGEEMSVPAAGPIAGDPRLDDLIAPELVSPPLRALLKKSGDLLDLAYPVDLRALRAAPLAESSAAFKSYVQQVAVSFGIQGLEVFSSPTLGLVCMPVSAAPAQIVFGQALLDSKDDAARYFLLIRSLKILQGNAALLSRTAPIELWPVLAAYLGIFAPDWTPQGVDAKKLSDAQQRIRAAAHQDLDNDVPVLALEVIGAIGNRASLLATGLHQWGNRTALLSAGSLVASLRGVALSNGQSQGPPKDGPERVKWIVRNPEARDLCTFGVSDQYTEARSRLGLTR